MDKDKITRLFAKSVRQQKMQIPAYNQSATFEWIATCGLPWLVLDIPVPHEIILEEIKNILPYFVAHRDQYNTNFGWESFCIHGKSYDATREEQFYTDERPLSWTNEALDLMPQTVNYFKNVWPCEQYDRLRIMKLAPGAIIEAHKDNLGPARMFPINIAITQPKLCDFYVEGQGVIPFRTGSAIWIDVGNRHCVINDSDEYRYHIIIHQKFETKKFEELVIRSYTKQYGHS